MHLADHIVMRPVEALIPYVRNARTHSDAQVAQIAGSIREFGFTNPILVDGENGLIAGHGRLLAARKLGMTKVPCIELAHFAPRAVLRVKLIYLTGPTHCGHVLHMSERTPS
jgi:ParB-like chromosome segregation protein Spo0J